MRTLSCVTEVCGGARKVCKLGVPTKSSTKYQPMATQPLEKRHQKRMFIKQNSVSRGQTIVQNCIGGHVKVFF